MSSAVLKVGFIGCGGIAGYHFNHYTEKLAEARITAVCDLIDERAAAAAKRFSATAYKDYREMLNREELDAVYICVEPCAHDGMELMAIEKGCHLFVEKPVALDLAYAQKVEKALNDKGLINAAGFQDRYIDFVPTMQNWVNTNEVGFFTGWWVGGMPGVWWWRNRKTSGGQAVEQTIHIFDMCRNLFGEVAEVQAFGRRGLMCGIENYDTEDASAVNLKFESGLIGTIYSGCFVQGPGSKCGIEAFAKTSHLEYVERVSLSIKEENRDVFCKVGNDYGMEGELAFIDAILDDDQGQILSSYSEAVKNLELTLAANRSLDNGGELVRLS